MAKLLSKIESDKVLFSLPIEECDSLGMEIHHEYELLNEMGLLVLVQRRPTRSEWSFKNPTLSPEDLQWIDEM